MNYKLKVTIPVVVCGGAVLAYYLIRRFVIFVENNITFYFCYVLFKYPKYYIINL